MAILDDIASRLALEIVKPAIDRTKTYFDRTYSFVIDYWGLKVRQFLGWVARSDISIFQWVENKINEMMPESSDGGTDTSGILSYILGQVIGYVEQFFVKFSQLPSLVLTEINRWFNNTIKSTIDYFQSWTIIFMNVITPSVRNFLSWVNGLGGSIVSWVDARIQGFLSTINNTVHNLTILVNTSIQAIASVVNNITDTINNIVNRAITLLNNALLAVIYSIRDSFIISIQELGETVRSITPDILKYVDDKMVDVMSYIDNLEFPDLGGIMTFFDDIKQTVLDAGGYLSNISDVITGTYEQPPEIQENIDKRQEIQDRIRQLISEL